MRMRSILKKGNSWSEVEKERRTKTCQGLLSRIYSCTWRTGHFRLLLGTFRSEDKEDYENKFSVLSMRTSKNVGLQTLCACSVRKTRTGSRSRPAIQRSLIFSSKSGELSASVKETRKTAC